MAIPNYQPQATTKDVLSALIGEPETALPAFVRDKPKVMGRDDFGDERLPF
jgi:hypothetical protein